MNTPWYKQFWPWFLIAVPLASLIMGGVILHLATSTEDSLVVDDYYKEGKAINARLDKIENAKRLGMSTEVVISESAVVVTFLTGMPRDGTALKLNFYHVTLEQHDFSVLLTQDATGAFRAPLTQVPSGKWTLTLAPLDDSWKLQKQVMLPTTSTIIIEP